MKIYVPSYYNDFKCTADKCKHNCCIGWEIDVDSDTLQKYSKYNEIMQYIDCNETPHFILSENDRCPFLNSKNLCQLIIKYGDDFLCQICRDHPRFYNFFDERTEIGLGLTCPAAAKLIIDNKFSLCLYGEDEEESYQNPEEKEFLKQRDAYFNKNIENFSEFLPEVKLSFLYDKFIGLERLDDSWENYLSPLKNNNTRLKDIKITNKNKAYNLFCYFVYRHLHNTSLAFCLLCTYIIFALGGDIYDTARMFSSEIEYSDENVEKIIEIIQKSL